MIFLVEALYSDRNAILCLRLKKIAFLMKFDVMIFLKLVIDLLLEKFIQYFQFFLITMRK